MTKDETYEHVQSAVAEALALDEDEVARDATLMDDLGAESIDLLDILFRLERSVGVKIQAADLGEHLQGGIPDDEFSTDDEVISEKGLAYLKQVMPQIDTDGLAGKLHADEVINLFTVENLADLVAARSTSTTG